MALNFSVSYTFSPSTTISSSQVNTNFSDVANVFQGLEAETKTLAKLKVDIDPTLALEVATKQYVDHYSTWRRPNLQYGSTTTVAVESGLDGTAGDIPILFPDGSIRTETSTTNSTFNIGRVAALSGTSQSGLRTGSVASNTWYALYAVKTTDNTTHWVTVGDTVLPLQANYATLNANFGTSGWVYLGLIRYGDGGGTATNIQSFWQSGNTTLLARPNSGGNADILTGIIMATTAGATSLSWTYAAGTSGAVVPANIVIGVWCITSVAGALRCPVTRQDDATAIYICPRFGSTDAHRFIAPTGGGITMTPAASVAMDIVLVGWIDNVLGVGSNPIL